MTDNYGNYFCKALIKYLQVHQRIHLLKKITGEKFIKISCNNRGTWALQEFILFITEREEYDIIKENLMVNDNVRRLAMDKEGEHLIQKIIETFSVEDKQYVFDKLMENFETLAKDKNGLCVMKKLIETTKTADNQRTIVELIKTKAKEYTQNEFGNFVVSEVMQKFDYEIFKDIYQCLNGSYVTLS